jgi:FAD/FMN-containing dehydrogenase
MEQIDVFGPLRPDFPIMRRLKQQFDPDGVLAPGRFMGRL